jgi:hypothetical protein
LNIVIPAQASVIPAQASVIPAQAGIQVRRYATNLGFPPPRGRRVLAVFFATPTVALQHFRYYSDL